MLAPQKGKPGGNRALGNNVTTDPTIIAQETDPGQAEVNMQQRAARAGCHLVSLAGGEFLLTHKLWAQTKSCPDLRSVGALLARLTGVST